jgi:hypothetical protein
MSRKQCNKCQRTKNIKNFYKDSSRPDGISYICKICDKHKFKKWKIKNKDQYNKTISEWREKNIDKVRANARKNAKTYRLKNKEKIKKAKNKYEKQKMKTDIHYRNKKLIRKRMRNAIKNRKCNQRTEFLLGCTIDEYVRYLESKFKSGMTWDNQKEWEIDHIIPCVAFNLNNIEEQRKCFHYSNTQPLWKKDHKDKTYKDLIKYSKYHNCNLVQ